MSILTSRLLLGAIALSVLIFGAMYFGAKWVYRDMPGDNPSLGTSVHPPIASVKLTEPEASGEDNVSSDANADTSTSTSDNLDWGSAVDDEMFAMLEDSVAVIDGTTEVVADEAASTVDIPESHFNPPDPPAGGIDAILEQATSEESVEPLTLEYMDTYYPLAYLEPSVVNQLDERQKAEYKRQNDALDKELLGSEYTLVKKVESLLRVPITVLNILRKE
jgi:hypothetical protein